MTDQMQYQVLTVFDAEEGLARSRRRARLMGAADVAHLKVSFLVHFMAAISSSSWVKVTTTPSFRGLIEIIFGCLLGSLT